jgi:3-hydroxyisobutyrate dehydrogenase-like beta-hydroxyacid dehydrogenase
MRVGVIGLGAMGMGAAVSCVRAGLEAWGCDLRDEARRAFAASGGQPCASPAEFPDGLDAVLLLVVNAAQTEAALFGPEGCAGRILRGGVVVSSATMSPDDARRLAQRAEALGLLYLDAPVSGGAAKAAAAR